MARQSFVGEVEIGAVVVFGDADVNRALRGVKLGAAASSRSTAKLIVAALARRCRSPHSTDVANQC